MYSKLSPVQYYIGIGLNLLALLYYSCIILYGMNNEITFNEFIIGNIIIIVVNSIFLDTIIDEIKLNSRWLLYISIMQIVVILYGFFYLSNYQQFLVLLGSFV